MVPKQRKRGRQGSGGNYRKRLGDAYTFAGKTTLKTSVGSSVKSQMDTTACIFLFSRQIPHSIARFMPFADMVTGENKS